MDWNVLVSALVVLAAVLVGSFLTWYFQGNLAAQQVEYQRHRDEAERIVAFRREYVLALHETLGELIALAIREVPQRQIDKDEITLNPDKWPKNWKMMRKEQDQLRDRINRFALMSPFRSTVEHARGVVECIDQYAKAEGYHENFPDSWDEEASEDEKQEWGRQYESLRNTLNETGEDLSKAAYAFRHHLEALVSRPDSDPG